MAHGADDNDDDDVYDDNDDVVDLIIVDIKMCLKGKMIKKHLFK